jgi:hypothetical protein
MTCTLCERLQTCPKTQSRFTKPKVTCTLLFENAKCSNEGENHLEKTVLRHVQERGRLLPVALLLHGHRHQRPQLVHVHDRAVELVHGLVEVAHSDLAEVARMVLVEQNAVMVHASGVTTTSGMLAVLAHTSMPGTDMASFLAVLLQPGRHGCRSQQQKQTLHREERGGTELPAAGFTPNPNSRMILVDELNG